MGRRRRFGTSATELIHLVVAIGVLTTAITLWMFNSGTGYARFGIVEKILISLGVAVTGFAFHEIGHKITAQHYGHWSEFRYSLPGLLLTLVAGFAGILFGAPGATWHTATSPKDNGKISAAGPLINILIATAAFPLSSAAQHQTNLLTAIADAVVLFNIALAVFNLIPLGPLDGRKVLRWNPFVYAMLVGLAILIIVYARPDKLIRFS